MSGNINDLAGKALSNLRTSKVDGTQFIDDAESKPVCEKCGGTGFFRLDVPIGHPEFGKVIKCDNPIHTIERANHWLQLSNLSESQLATRLDDIDTYHRKANLEDAPLFAELSTTGIEKAIADDRLYASNKRALTAAKAFLQCHSRHSHKNGLEAPFNRPRGWFYVWGTNGNAKSVMLLAMYNALREDYNMHGLYVTLPKLVNLVREAYNERQDREKARPGEFQARGKEGRIEAIANVPVLAIDEFDMSDGKLAVTDFAMEIVQDILNRRYDKASDGTHITLFASNSNPDTFPALVVDRLRDGRFWIVRNTAPSKRPFMKWSDE